MILSLWSLTAKGKDQNVSATISSRWSQGREERKTKTTKEKKNKPLGFDSPDSEVSPKQGGYRGFTSW
jgi:hypothetical protein